MVAADGYPDSLVLCTIDSIFSTASHYKSVTNVVAEYCAYRRNHGGNPYRDGIKELLATFEEVGGSAGWAKLVDNRKPAHTKPGALMKAEVILRAARALKSVDIMSLVDLHELHAQDEHVTPVKAIARPQDDAFGLCAGPCLPSVRELRERKLVKDEDRHVMWLTDPIRSRANSFRFSGRQRVGTTRRTVHRWVESGRIESTKNELGKTRIISDPASSTTPRS